MHKPTPKALKALGDQSPLFEDDLVAFWFEEAVRVNGVQPPKLIRSRMVVKIKEAIKERQPRDVIRATITRMIEEALSPAQFEEVMWKIQHELATGDTKEDRELIRRFMEAHGGEWPTGSRFIRGTTSGTFKQDVLGFDRPGYKVPWGKPSRDDVVAALKRLVAAGVDITGPDVTGRDVGA